MKVVILAGGMGTRISEESHLKPKPMVDIGEKPILWHIMKTYSFYGYNDFIICLGYKGYYIKEYFAHYFLHESDVTFDFRTNSTEHIHHNNAEPWKVTLVNTGLNTMTGGRIKRIREYIDNKAFLMTYGDGLSDVDIPKLVEFHESHGKLATVTTTQPGGRFGHLDLGEEDQVMGFEEKPKGDGSWVNAGFFVLEPEVLDYIDGDETIFEKCPMNKLARENQLMAYRHPGFWQPMDTIREKNLLEEMWQSNKAPWKLWER